MITVSLEAAKVLKTAGYPQDQWPQMIYLGGDPKEYGVLCYRYQDFVPEPERPPLEVVAAPDPLSALYWLEREKGWYWERRARAQSGEERWIAGRVTAGVVTGVIDRDTADALILAICQKESL